MKKNWSMWKRKAAFLLVCCIVTGGLAGLPMFDLSAAGLKTETAFQSGRDAAEETNSTETEPEAEEANETETATEETSEAEAEKPAEETNETETGPEEENVIMFVVKQPESEKDAVLADAGPVDRTYDIGEVGIAVKEFRVQNASNQNLICTGPATGVYDASSNPYYDVAKVKFRMQISVKKEWNAGRALKAGDYVSLPIPDGFSCANRGEMTSGGRLIATYQVEGSALKITFAESVNADQKNSEIKGGMDVELTFDAEGSKGKDKMAVVVPERGAGEPAIRLKLPEEPNKIDGIQKSGQLNNTTNEITWTVKVGTDASSKGVSLDGVELTESLPEGLEIAENGVAATSAKGDVTVTQDGQKLTLSGANAVAPVTVMVKTNIAADALTKAINDKQTELKLANQVSMGSSDGSLRFGEKTAANDTVSVKLSPAVEKQGTQIDSNTIRWTIKVNSQNPVRIYHGRIVDELVQGLKYKKGSMRCNGGSVSEVSAQPQTDPWPGHTLWAETGTDHETLHFYMNRDTSASYTITFDTTVSDGFMTGSTAGEEPKVHNEAMVFAEFPTGNGMIPVEYGIPGINTVFNTAKVNKTVSADGTKVRGQLAWTIYPSVRSSSYTTAQITDTIENNQRYCADTLKIYEAKGGNWQESTDALKQDRVFSVEFSESTKTLTLEYAKAKAQGSGHSTTLSDYKIMYETDALTYMQENNVSDKYENTAKLTVTEGSSTYVSQGSASAKLKNEWAVKDTKFEYDANGVPCFHYTITVNKNKIANLTNVAIHDSIADAIKLKSNDQNVSEDWAFDDTATKVRKGTGNIAEGIAYSADKKDVTITFGTLSETVVVDLYAKYVGEKSKLTTGIYKDQKVYSDNTAAIASVEVAAEGGNAISVKSNTKNRYEMDNTLVKKEYLSTDSSGNLVWQVIINPNSGQMGTVTIKDTIPKTQKYIQDSVKLYGADYAGGTLKPAASGTPCTPKFKVDKTNRYMELELGASDKPLILEYQTALVDKNAKQATNDVQVSDGASNYGTATGEKDISAGDWGTMRSEGNLVLRKQDASIGSDMPLAGAEFTIYEDVSGEITVDVGETADDGTVTFFGLDVPAGMQRTYYYRETKTPEGYQTDNEIHPVTVEKSETVTYPVDNFRKTENGQISKVALKKKFIYTDKAGSPQAAEGKQAAFRLMFYPYGEHNKSVAKPVSVTGMEGSYRYSPSASGAVTEIKNNPETGRIEIEGLPWGYYGIQETGTAPGFCLDGAEHFFEIRHNDSMSVVYHFGDNPAKDNAVLTNAATSFLVAKYEEGTENPISGIRLQICEKNPDGSSGSVVKDALNGNAPYEWETGNGLKTIYNLPAGTYFLHEDAAASTNLDYAVAKEDVAFTVLESGAIEGTSDSTVKTYSKTITLKITKVDQFDHPVLGATLQMTGPSNYEETETTESGKHVLAFGNLQRKGTYTLREDAAPDTEHLAIDPITVVVSEDGNSFQFSQEDEDGKNAGLKLNEDGTLHVVDRKLFVPITVKKVDGQQGTSLTGAGFELYAQKSDSGPWIKFCDIETGTGGSWEMSALADSIKNPFDNGKTLSLGLKPGRYYLEETKAPQGYKALPDDTKMGFEITAEGTIQLDDTAGHMTVSGTTFTITDMPFTLRIQPLEFDDGHKEGLGECDLNDRGTVYEVAGQFIGLDGTASEGTVVLNGRTEDAFAQKNNLTGRLIPGKVYTITEKTAPAGYLAPEPVYVKINEQGEAFLCDSSGNDTKESDSYCKVENCKNDMDGIANGYDGLVKIYHGKTRAQLIKYSSWDSDGGDNKTLSGVSFMLEGSLAGMQAKKEYVTDTEGKIVFEGILVDGETYTLTETPYPGCQILEAVSFTYSAEDGIKLTSGDPENVALATLDGMPLIEITNESAQNTSLQFLVYDCTDGAGLPGAKFKMTCQPEDGGSVTETMIETNESGKVCTYVTAGEVHKKVTAEGEAFVTDLQPGQYTLQQTEAPYGYCLSEKSITITFTVDADAKNKTIVINETNVRNHAYHLTATEDGPKVISKGICNKRIAGTVIINKQDYDSSAPLNGVGFAIYRYKEADNIFELLKNLLTGKAYAVTEQEWEQEAEEDGRLTITGLEWGKYYIVETNPLAGYASDKARYDFEIGKDKLTQTLAWTPGTLKNTKIQIIILPTNALYDQADVAGHKMRISGRFQNTNVPYIEWEETEEGYVIAGMLIPGEIYTLEEATVLPGYSSGKSFQFKYNGYGEVEKFSGDGTDIIMEADGTVKLVQRVEPLKVRVRKVDEDGKLLAGAVLGLYVQDETGAKTLAADVTTDGSAWELSGDTYRMLQVGAACILTEKSAPKGYALAEDVSFVVADGTNWQEITMTDKREQEEATEPDTEDVTPDIEQNGGGTPGSVNKNEDDRLRSAATLPKTGRESRAVFYVAGGIFVVSGVLLLLYGRRKEKK